MRPVPTPDGWLEPAALLWEGECVVDGSIHYIGCWCFWEWGGCALWAQPVRCQLASYWGGRVELWLRLLKRCSGPFLPTLLVNTCRVCATGPREPSREMSTVGEHAKLLQSCAMLWTVAYQAPLSMGFSGQEYWCGLPCPSPEGSSQPRKGTQVSCIAGRFFTI